MTLAEKIHDAFLDRDLTPDDINLMIAERLYLLLCKADGALSAIRHGRKLEDKELEEIYYPIRDFCDELTASSGLYTVSSRVTNGRNTNTD